MQTVKMKDSKGKEVVIPISMESRFKELGWERDGFFVSPHPKIAKEMVNVITKEKKLVSVEDIRDMYNKGWKLTQKSLVIHDLLHTVQIDLPKEESRMLKLLDDGYLFGLCKKDIEKKVQRKRELREYRSEQLSFDFDKEPNVVASKPNVVVPNTRELALEMIENLLPKELENIKVVLNYKDGVKEIVISL